MPQVINTNMMSLNSQRSLNRSQSEMMTSVERLSSGLRINKAKDDAAGLAISDRMTAQIRGIDQAMRNANDGISMVQTADGAMAEISNALQRMRELAVQAANGTVNATDKASLNDEYQELVTTIGDIVTDSKFNGVALLDGSAPAVDLQVGYEAGATTTINFANISTLTATDGDDILSAANAAIAIDAIDDDLDTVSSARADMGAIQSGLESRVRNMASVSENMSAARSRILDADFAKETANLTRTQILQQAGTAMLAQANQMPQNVLSLLQ